MRSIGVLAIAKTLFFLLYSSKNNPFMARIKVSLAEKSFFETEIPVRITDLNYGNHLANDKLLSIIHEARVQFLQSFGFSEMDLGGCGIIMADVAIEYKAQSYYADVLIVKIGIHDLTRVSFDLTYEILKKSSDQNILIAKAKTGIVTFDYQTNKVVEVPKAFLEKLQD